MRTRNPPEDVEVIDRAEIGPTPPSMLIVAMASLLAMAISLAASVAYVEKSFRGDLPKFAVLDLATVVEDQQLVFTTGMMERKDRSKDAAAEEAYDSVAKFASQLEKSVEELRVECRCTILTKAAVIGNNPLDLTPALRAKLGLQGVDKAKLQERLKVLMAAK